jgi:pimeloyl-ACP methyl ester carboxylesterase
MGPTVLALHGLTSTTKVWSALAAALPEARIVAPDLAGRGGRTPSPLL